MNVELVRVKTVDGYRLDGALSLPAAVTAPTGVDAALLVHGVGSNFYGSTMMEAIAHALATAGIAAIRVNTRGHDGVSTASTDRGGVLAGAAYEIVDDCRSDLRAWIDFLVGRGCQRIALVGHSLGALKALYSQSLDPHAQVPVTIAISPPRLSYAHFAVSPRAESFLSSYAEASRWIERGESKRLFQATFPFPLVLAATTFVDKYGPEERYNLLRFVAPLADKVEFVFGQKELADGNPAFERIVEDLRELGWHAPPPIHLVGQADHFYVGCVPALVELVTRRLVDRTDPELPASCESGLLS